MGRRLAHVAIAVCLGVALTVVLVVGALQVGDHVTCDTTPVPVPRPDFCWDTLLQAVRPFKAVVFVADAACCPLNLTGPLVVATNQTLFVGLANGVGASTSEIHGSVRVASGGRLSVTSMNLTIHGNLLLESGARLSVTESDATRTHIIVDGCVVVGEPSNATRLDVELAVSDGNRSRSYVIFDVPGGCINGSFGIVNATYTLAAGQTTYYPPGVGSCLQPAGLALLVNMVCDAPAPVPTPSPRYISLSNASIRLPGTTSAINSTPSSSNNSVVESPASIHDTPPVDWVLWGVVVGIFIVGTIAAIVTAVLLMRSRATRSALFPYRDREHYQPRGPDSPSAVPMRDSSHADHGYVLSDRSRHMGT